ncbi:MAG: hypothetical protein ACI8UR_001807 [Natronomonas sp.]
MFVQPENGLRLHERDVLLHAVGESVPPPRRRRDGRLRVGVDEYLLVPNVDRKRLGVVGPGVERVALLQFEASVMPMTGEYPLVDGAADEWETHVRTAIVDSVDLRFVEKEGDCLAVLLDDSSALAFEFREVTDGDVLVGRHVWGLSAVHITVR